MMVLANMAERERLRIEKDPGCKAYQIFQQDRTLKSGALFEFLSMHDIQHHMRMTIVEEFYVQFHKDPEARKRGGKLLEIWKVSKFGKLYDATIPERNLWIKAYLLSRPIFRSYFQHITPKDFYT